MKIARDGESLTPKQFAEQILMNEIYNQCQNWYTKQNEYFGLELSEKEIKAINSQMSKISTRLAKKLHFNIDFLKEFEHE